MSDFTPNSEPVSPAPNSDTPSSESRPPQPAGPSPVREPAPANDVESELASVDLDKLESDLNRLRAAADAKWGAAEYAAGGVHGHSAAKLASSFVAPLVAAARGYHSFDESQVEDIGPAFGHLDKRKSQTRKVYEAAARADVLLMPWYAVDSVASNPADPERTSVQFRPGVLPPAEYDDDGKSQKQAKYEFLSGSNTPVAAHPAIDPLWITEAPIVLIAEGLLKGDAALTGYLLHHGITREELSYDGVGDARTLLRSLMARIAPQDRICVLTIAGVWNWRNNPEWNSLALREREVWLGIDGDVASKPQVWNATRQLWDYIGDKKKANLRLLAPVVPSEKREQAEKDDKVGIDDFLAEYGSWSDLLESLSDRLPDKPKDADYREGDVRISEDGCSMERYEVIERDAAGRALAMKWSTIIPLGGRIAASVAERLPSDEETASGVLGAGVNEQNIDWEVEVEVSFKNEMGEVESHSIVGPHYILNYLPEKWHDKKADIPGPVMVHPEWPPRGKDAEAWIKAVKQNAPEKVVRRVRWANMGWVPVRGGVPVFIVGNQVIGGGEVESETDEALPGVTNSELDRASSFGVGPDNGLTFDSEEYRQQVKEAIEAVMETYVFNGVWKDRRNAAVIIATGLRPALPVRPKAIPYFTGTRGSGKTFSAEAAIAFWQERPGSLIPVPGSAKDTAAAMELAVARSVIWVIDDLAPSSSRRQSEDEKDKIGNLIRNQFNGTAKARSNANMESRKRNNPRSLLVITAENEPSVSSELDRVILCDISHGSLADDRQPTNLMTQMVEDGQHYPNAPALVAQALVKYLRYQASRNQVGWASVYELVVATREQTIQNAQAALEGRGSRRHATTAADLMMVYKWLEQMAKDVGCSKEVRAALGARGYLANDILSLVGQGAVENRSTSPGRALIEALSAVLRRGRAHVVNADDPTIPPVDDPKTEAARLRALGWNTRDGETWQPAANTDAIGWVVDNKGEKVVIFDPSTAFAVAQQHSPSTIPHGQQQRSSWSAVTGEGFGVVEMLRVQNGKRINSTRKMTNGATRNGYPVALDQVLRGGLLPTEEPNYDDRERDEEAQVD